MNPTDISLLDFESIYYITECMERLDGLADYLAVMEAQVVSFKAKEAEKLKKDLEGIPDSCSNNDEYSFVQWREHQYRQFEYSIPESYHYSFVVLLWLVVEDELKRVCGEIARRKGAPTPSIDRRNGIIKPYMNFLDTTGGLPLRNIAHWHEICHLQKIRNRIVHASGRIDESGDIGYLTRLKGKHIGLQIDEEQRLRVEPDYCKLAIRNTIEFFAEILDGVGIKIWKEPSNW
jgi:hypothetical protein